MPIKKIIYLFIALMLTYATGKAQTTFSISSFAMSAGSVTTIGGSPFVGDGKGKCLNISSGLSTLSQATNARGVFGASCTEVPPVATVLVIMTSLNVYPNPTRSTSTLKCEGQFDANLSCQVRIVSMEGRVMMNQMVPMKELQAGYTLNVGAYAAGVYAVGVDFMNQHYNLKLIKL